MDTQMKAAVDSRIKTLLEEIKREIRPDDALKLSQAALNLSHVKATLDLVKD